MISSEPVTQLSFERHGGLVFLPVRIGDSEPLSFILETGAQPSIIDSDVARRLNLAHGQTSVASGAGAGSNALSVIKDSSIQVGRVKVRSPLLIATPFKGLGRMTGHPIEGGIGNDFVRRFVVVIDYAAHTVGFYDPRNFESHADWIPIDVSSGHATVNATIWLHDGRSANGSFAIDTGASPAAVFSPRFVQANDLMSAIPRLHTVTGRGLVGSTDVPLGRVKSIGIGNQIVVEPVCGFSRDTVGAFATQPWMGIIGNALWERFTVTLDYQRSRMRLEPNPKLNEWELYDASGISIVAEGDGLDRITVSSVAPESPAEISGLLPGDVIDAIDSVRNLTLTEARARLRIPNRNVSLELSRTGSSLKATILTRELV